jgi:hypothetical protein
VSHIFLSYSHNDSEYAHAVATALEQHGWTVFWDKHLNAGQAFDRVLADSLESAAAVVVLWSKNSSESDWVRDEAESAKARGVLVPVLIESTKIPLGFGRTHTLDLSQWDGRPESAQILELNRSLKSLTGQPTTQPPSINKPVPGATSATAPATGATGQTRLLIGAGIALVIIGALTWLAFDRRDQDGVIDASEPTATTADSSVAETAPSEPADVEEPDPIERDSPVRATVDAGTVVPVDKRTPVIGTDLAPTLNPPEYAPIKQLDYDVVAFVDRASTSNRQFYDFATFQTSAIGVDADAIWAELAPASWLAVSPDVPDDFERFGLDPRAAVAGVSYDTAEQFCDYALKRLPSEIEWELAARDGSIDVSTVQNWVKASDDYGPVPAGTSVLRGSFGIEALPMFFRTIGDTPTNRLNAGIRCAADDVVEYARPTGELLYAREFSGADVSHDWPDFHEAQTPEVAFGYHAPDVFHIEVRSGRGVAVGSGTAHPDDAVVSADFELRLPPDPSGGFQYGLVANAGPEGYVAILVTDQIAADGSRSLQWCATQRSDQLLAVGVTETISPSASTAPCRAEGTTAVNNPRFRLSIKIAIGEATFSIDDQPVGAFATPYQLEGSFGFLVENQDPAITTHVHFDNLAVVSG